MEMFLTLMALKRSIPWRKLLQQLLQLQLVQKSPLAKQSQYLWGQSHSGSQAPRPISKETAGREGGRPAGPAHFYLEIGSLLCENQMDRMAPSRDPPGERNSIRFLL